MILPSDSDLPSDRNNEGQSSHNPEETPWWEDPDLSSDDGSGEEDSEDQEAGDLPFGDEDEDDENEAEELLPHLASIAGPGWRKELAREILESLGDLEAIEDPDDEFAPPEPPDLYTFFGELAALRNELRHQGQRSNDSLNQLDKTLAPLLKNAAKTGKRSGTGAAAGAGEQDGDPSWTAEARLSLISLWDLLPQATAAAAFEASFAPLLAAAGMVRVPTAGQVFDPATMTRTGTEPATKTHAAGQVIRETTTGFLCGGNLLRPAGVIVSI